MIRRVVQICMQGGVAISPPINEEIETFGFYTTTNGQNCDILCKSGIRVNLTHAQVLESNGDDPAVLSFRIVGLQYSNDLSRLLGQEVWVIATNPQAALVDPGPGVPQIPEALNAAS
jgi:hypothetical protein